MHVAFRTLSLGALTSALLLTLPAPALAGTYKCIQEDGQTLYSSTPCARDAQAVGDHTSVVPAFGRPQGAPAASAPAAAPALNAPALNAPALNALSASLSSWQHKLSEFVDALKSYSAEIVAGLALAAAAWVALWFFRRPKKVPNEDQQRAEAE